MNSKSPEAVFFERKYMILIAALKRVLDLLGGLPEQSRDKRKMLD